MSKNTEVGSHQVSFGEIVRRVNESPCLFLDFMIPQEVHAFLQVDKNDVSCLSPWDMDEEISQWHQEPLALDGP